MFNSKKIAIIHERMNQLDNYMHDLMQRIEVCEKKLDITNEYIEKMNRNVNELIERQEKADNELEQYVANTDESIVSICKYVQQVETRVEDIETIISNVTQ